MAHELPHDATISIGRAAPELAWERDDELQRALSNPPGYVIEWRRTSVGGPLFYNAWRGEGAGRVHMHGGLDGAECKRVCQEHFDKHHAPSFDALKPSAHLVFG